MSINDEIWDKCEICGKTITTFYFFKHGPGKCGSEKTTSDPPECPTLIVPDDSPAINHKKLRSLEEVNLEKLNSLSSEYKTGVKCPECKEERELIFTSPYTLLLSNPPKREVECVCCGYSNYLLY